MVHTHSHSHDSASGYFTEQLLTILVGGLFGYVAIAMYRSGGLVNLLAPQFHPWVLGGGIAIIVLVAIRLLTLWWEAGKLAHDHHHDSHNHDHDHDHDHDHHSHDHSHAQYKHHQHSDLHHHHDHNHNHQHEHSECNHMHSSEADEEEDNHGHSHDLSWVMAKMLILVFPIALFFMGLPNATYSKERQLRMLGQESALGSQMLEELAANAVVVEVKNLPDGSRQEILRTASGLRLQRIHKADGGQAELRVLGGEGRRMRFNDLNDAAFDPAKRESLQGQIAILEGRFRRLGDKEFTLFRLKMTCCAADTVPLRVRIVVPQALSGFNDFDWVEVKGQIQFVKVSGQERYLPVIMVADITDVRKTEPKNEYEL